MKLKVFLNFIITIEHTIKSGINNAKYYIYNKQPGPTVQHRELFQFPVINYNRKEYVKQCIYV